MNKRSLIKAVGVIAAIALIWFFWGKEEWTLMVCKTKLNDAECYDNSYVIPGFASAKECLLEGSSRYSKEGFECGKNCKENDYGMKVCDEICNASGCR